MEIRRFKKSDTKGVVDLLRVPMDVLNAKIQSIFDAKVPLDRKFKAELKNLIKYSDAGVTEMLNDIRESISCVACEEGKIIGYGALRDVKLGSSCMVLPEYQGQGIEEKLDEACWQYAFKERPAANTLPQDAYVLNDREWGNTLDTLLQMGNGKGTKSRNFFND